MAVHWTSEVTANFGGSAGPSDVCRAGHSDSFRTDKKAKYNCELMSSVGTLSEIEMMKTHVNVCFSGLTIKDLNCQQMCLCRV